jgi:FdhD protein
MARRGKFWKLEVGSGLGFGAWNLGFDLSVHEGAGPRTVDRGFDLATGELMSDAVRPVEILRVGREPAAATDVAAAEEPLEIRLDGQSFVVTMRTPGADADLAAGFLLSEQIVRAASEIADIRHCPPNDNILYVTLVDEGAIRAAEAMNGRRHVTVTSACGVCGRRSIDDLMNGARKVESTMSVGRRVIEGLPGALRAAQRAFDQTGGLHAAGLFDAEGTLIRIAEDVGRHNAVDKVLGGALRAGRLPLSDRLLFVSGRTSFEIIQKAVVAGVAVVAAVSAPSSLAIDLARDANVTLIGFVRGATFNIYAAPERVVLKEVERV